MYEFLTSAKMFEAGPPQRSMCEARQINKQGLHVENLSLVRGGDSLRLGVVKSGWISNQDNL